MSSVSISKAKYAPTLFERLADNAPREITEADPLRMITIEQLKESVANDLESLLNCRSAFRRGTFSRYPEALMSMCSYGMSDFVGLSLASPRDRNHICKSLEGTIAVHEPRLRQVSVSLEIDATSVNKLRFAIHALLLVHPTSEPVYFDAMLQPSTLRYSVNRGRHLGMS